VWEVDAFFTPARICEPPRPYWTKMGLVAEARSGLVLGMMTVGVSCTMAAAAAEALVQALRRHQHRPAKLRLCSTRLIQTLTPLAAGLHIAIEPTEQLPMIEQARQSLVAFLRHS
jgi:hypothetical protein